MVHGTGMLLLTTIGGYLVLERAEGHKGSLRRIGRILGTAIVVISLLSIACGVWCASGSCPMFGSRMMARKTYCPVAGMGMKGMSMPDEAPQQ